MSDDEYEDPEYNKRKSEARNADRSTSTEPLPQSRV